MQSPIPTTVKNRYDRNFRKCPFSKYFGITMGIIESVHEYGFLKIFTRDGHKRPEAKFQKIQLRGVQDWAHVEVPCRDLKED